MRSSFLRERNYPGVDSLLLNLPPLKETLDLIHREVYLKLFSRFTLTLL